MTYFNKSGGFSKSKLAEVIKSFSKKEYKSFGSYLNSPYFNKSAMMIKLYEFFRTFHNNDKIDYINAENISRAVYGNRKKSNDVLLRKQLSDFLKHAEDFLVYNELKRNNALVKNILLDAADNRKLNSTFNSTVRQLDSYYDSEEDKNPDYYLNRLNTKIIIYRHDASTLKAPEENIRDLSNSLDLYFLSLKLLYYYDILNLRLHYNRNVEFDMWAFDEISRLIETNREIMIKENSAIYADYLSVLMLLHPAEGSYYTMLKDFVKNNSSNLGTTSIHKIYVILYNHSVYRLNRGLVENNNELFEVIKIMDSLNVPIWNYFAFHIFYVNAVTNAARKGEYEWAEDFIKRRKDKIPQDIREETNSLALANLYFTTREYDKALKFLVNVDFPNYSYYLMAKDMLIKIYWERSESEGVLSAIDAMRKFLQRKELIPQRLYDSYTNFINCVSRMVDKDRKNTEYEVNKILEKEMISADKAWVKDKLKELGAKS